MSATVQLASVHAGTPRGRWIVGAMALGSGIVFLDGTVVNVALPSIARDLGADLASLQWTFTAYLLTLGSLLVLGGSIGDVFGRRRAFLIGLAVFTGASVACGLAPSVGWLIGFRAVQGIGGALLVPESLAIISATFAPEDRGSAIGSWSGLAAVSAAIGPFLGGFLIDSVSWRLIFLINVPLAVAAAVIVSRHVPETRDPDASGRLDYLGAAVVTLGLAGVVFALIEGPERGFSSPVIVTFGIAGMAFLALFPFVERRASAPMAPLEIFRRRQFVGANVTTLCVYGALGGAFVFVMLELQTVMGYSALEAGAAFAPMTLLLLTLSSRMGRLADRIGPRIPMTVGPLVAGAGFALLSRLGPGASYLLDVLPGVVTFGIGMSITVAPLTAAVLAAIEDRRAGVASAINNAVSRIAGLLAVALMPLAAGMAGSGAGDALEEGFARVMWIAAGLCLAGAVVAFATVSEPMRVEVTAHPSPHYACHAAELADRPVEASA
jgi:EmrB/QacA subfamily drug resistance transporter